jgi:hypothetical protein
MFYVARHAPQASQRLFQGCGAWGGSAGDADVPTAEVSRGCVLAIGGVGFRDCMSGCGCGL